MGSERRIIAAMALALAVAAAAGFAIEQVRDAIETAGAGLDFTPLRDAASALLRGASVYTDRRFVYPPTAAVAALPLAAGGRSGTLDVWLGLCAAAVALAAALALAPWQRSWRSAVLAAAAAALALRSDVLRDTLWLGNVSLLLAPVAVAVLALFEGGRWRAGSALLVLSLLIKPLLVPLLLLPLLRGRWRELAAAVAAGCVALGAAIVLVPGGGHLFAVLGHLEGGSSLTGRASVYNISLGALLASGWGWAARGAVIAVAAAALGAWALRPDRRGATAAIGTLLLLAVFLAGSLAEDHYLLVTAPCLLAALALAGDRDAALAALPALVLVVFPRSLVSGAGGSPADLQVRYVLAELALAVPATLLVWRATSAASRR